jgi:hypothetical protein
VVKVVGVPVGHRRVSARGSGKGFRRLRGFEPPASLLVLVSPLGNSNRWALDSAAPLTPAFWALRLQLVSFLPKRLAASPVSQARPMAGGNGRTMLVLWSLNAYGSVRDELRLTAVRRSTS